MKFTLEVRPVVSADRIAVLNLAPRLASGVAPWRNQVADAAAVRGWIENSIEPQGGGGAAFVAVVDDRVVGFVSVATTDHFAGERDAYIGELIVEGLSRAAGSVAG